MGLPPGACLLGAPGKAADVSALADLVCPEAGCDGEILPMFGVVVVVCPRTVPAGSHGLVVDVELEQAWPCPLVNLRGEVRAGTRNGPPEGTAAGGRLASTADDDGSNVHKGDGDGDTS